MKCIYCSEDKASENYTHTEHVIPQCLGAFKNNLTLDKLVCNDCNQFFGDNLELALGRDSLEGIARYRFGIGPQKLPLFKRLRLKVEGPQQVKGVHVIPKLPSGKATHEIQAVSQVGFFNLSTNEYEYFTMAEVPSKEELEEKGLLSSSHPMVFYGEVRELLEGLKAKGINIKITETKKEQLDMPPAMVPVRVRARIDAILYRAFSKIVFNYLAYCEGREFVLSNDFDGIRAFIRYGQGESGKYFEANTVPILLGEKKAKKRKYPGHIVCIDWEDTALIGKLSLFNSVVGITYKIRFCNNFHGFLREIRKGHYFDPITKDISPLFVSGLTWL